MQDTRPLFEQRATRTFDEATAVFKERGTQYSDTWRTCRFLTMKAIAKELGCSIDDRFYRALATAAFVDMKHERLMGGYKEDSLTDGINYAAFLVDEMRELSEVRKQEKLVTAEEAVKYILQSKVPLV